MKDTTNNSNSFESLWDIRSPARSVATAFGLGAAIGIGLTLSNLSELFADFGFYLIVLSLFHLWEYMFVCIFHPADVTAESFMVNHSKEFNMALIISWIEYIFELYYFPWLKGHPFIYIIGFLFALGGQSLRTIAMVTTGHNFSHRIATVKRPEHVLVRHGVYSAVRHPSYTGWFIWSVSTQVILANPICILAYAYVSWVFFQRRIRFEEETLLSHFGEEYRKYQREVPSGIPFVQ